MLACWGWLQATPGPARADALPQSLQLAAATAPGVDVPDAGDTPQRSRDANAQDAAAAGDGIRLTLAPIQYWGTLSFEQRLRSAQGGARESQQVVSATMRGATYVWQPWFAQLRGGLGLVAVRNDVEQAGGLRSIGLTGDLTLSLVPVSRFPLNAYLDIGDSRADGDFSGVDYRTVRYGFSQSYSPANSGTRYFLAFDQSTIRVDDGAGASGSVARNGAADKVRTLRGAFSRSFGPHSVDVDASLSANRRDDPSGDARSRSDVLTARHSYQPIDALSIENLASLTRFEQRLPTAEDEMRLSLSTVQLSSFATYRPRPGDVGYSEQHPLYLTANFRVVAVSSEVADTQFDTRSVFASLGLNYQLSRRIRLLASTSLGRLSGSSGVATTSFGQSVGLSYAGDPKRAGDWLYTHSASANASLARVSGTQAQTRTAANLGLSHGLSRNWRLGGQSTFALSFGQGVSAVHGTERSLGGGLTHTLALSWRGADGGARQSLLSLTATDARALGSQGTDFQMLNLQASQQQALSRVSHWSGNLTFQATRSRSRGDTERLRPGVSAAGWNTSYGADLSYVHRRAFGVPNLHYTASLNASSFDIDRRDQGNVDAPIETATVALDQRLEYRIGRLVVRLSARWAQMGGKGNWMVFLRLTRAFGRR